MDSKLGILDFYLPTRLIFGWGRAEELPAVCKAYGNRGLMVTMRDFPHGQEICKSLEDSGMDMTIFDQCEPEPSAEGIDSAWASLKGKSFDFFISVGGGSVMDTAKAFRILKASGGSAWEYTVEMGEDKRPVPTNLLPQIAVPTTSGTGAEVTQVAVVTNKAQKKKAPIVDPEIYPTVAVVDPAVTVSMPQYVTVTTGFDAFVHAHEHFFGRPELSLWDINSVPPE